MNYSYIACPLNPDSERAFVLIIVLWVSVGLVSVALLFGHSMMLEFRSADNTVAGMEAEQAVEGAARYVMYILANAETPGQFPEETTYTSEWAQTGNSLFWMLGRDTDTDTDTNTNQIPHFGLIDECGKLNLNTATQEMLEALPGMTEELAAAIIDWRDEDDDLTENGAESQYYSLLNPNYQCKNAPFETIEELHLLHGAYWEIIRGEDMNLNGVLDPNENDGNVSLPYDNQDGYLDYGILEYVTVYSREPSGGSGTEEAINISEQNNQELTQLITETFEEDRAAEIQARLTGQSEFTSILEFYIRSQMTMEEFAEIADRLTVSDEEQTEGLINVNTASKAVLACIPGIGGENASSLISYRSKNTDNLETVAWLGEVLEDEDAIEAGPYVTSKSYQYTVDAAAVGHNGKGYRRMRFVIDISGEEPVIRYRFDLTKYGWALGRDIRNELAYLWEYQK